MKAILIMDNMPSNCYECPLCVCYSYHKFICSAFYNQEIVTEEEWTEERYSKCPLITEDQYVDRLYSVLYDSVVRGILFQKELANKVSVKNVGEEE